MCRVGRRDAEITELQAEVDWLCGELTDANKSISVRDTDHHRREHDTDCNLCEHNTNRNLATTSSYRSRQGRCVLPVATIISTVMALVNNGASIDGR